jgi:hypothetical protein
MAYEGHMKRWLIAIAALAGACSACGGSNEGAAAPAAPQPTTGAAALASLDAKSAQQESWTLEDVVSPVPFLFFASPGFKLSASCKKPDGALDCAALTYIRNGMPTEIPRRELDGRAPAGVKVCAKMKNQVVNGNNAVGSTDTFCRFPDGSLITVGALEQYSLRIIQ